MTGYDQVQPAPTLRWTPTTAPINPGNSGGPLVDSGGHIIGINSSIVYGAQNIGFAVPINTVKSVVVDLRKNGRVIRPWLGIKGKVVTEELRNLIALPLVSGVLILDVDEKSSAEAIGLRAGTLDVTIKQYNSVLGPLKVGQSIQVTVVRDGEYLTKSVTLGERPPPPISPQHPQFEVPLVAPQGLTVVPL